MGVRVLLSELAVREIPSVESLSAATRTATVDKWHNEVHGWPTLGLVMVPT
jgi:hypothetical protein